MAFLAGQGLMTDQGKLRIKIHPGNPLGYILSARKSGAVHGLPACA